MDGGGIWYEIILCSVLGKWWLSINIFQISYLSLLQTYLIVFLSLVVKQNPVSLLT